MLAQNCRYCPAATWLEENGGRVMIGLRAFEPMAKQLNHAGLHERVGQRSRACCPESGLVDHRVKCTTDDCITVEVGASRIVLARSEERRCGKDCVSQGSTRCSPYTSIQIYLQ